VARVQIPPRNTDRAAPGKWAHPAKIDFEKCLLRKVRSGHIEPCYEKMVLRLMGVEKVRA